MNRDEFFKAGAPAVVLGAVTFVKPGAVAAADGAKRKSFRLVLLGHLAAEVVGHAANRGKT